MKPIVKGSSEHKVERRRYLEQLVHEYGVTNSKAAKLQVLANLANFAYDPYNYEFLRQLKVVDIFLYELRASKNVQLVQYAMGGLCNCSPDDLMQQEIIRAAGVEAITKQFLITTDVPTILHALGCLISLTSAFNLHEVASESFQAKTASLARHEDVRVRNLLNIYMKDIHRMRKPPT